MIFVGYGVDLASDLGRMSYLGLVVVPILGGTIDRFIPDFQTDLINDWKEMDSAEHWLIIVNCMILWNLTNEIKNVRTIISKNN
jgi:hypothetical protein